MKRIFTFLNGFNKPMITKVSLVTIFTAALFFTGCYEWRTIIMPDTVSIDSYFDVFLSAQDDGNPDNDWTNPDNHDIGLFGVLLPVGWTVRDSIEFQVITTEPGYDNDGIMIYSAEHSQNLLDSLGVPFGYYWWGAKSDGEVSMIYFDSLYLEPRIYTDDKTGDFYIRYAIGDENYWDRDPADDVSDPIQITAIDYTDVDEMLETKNISLFPNPASDHLNIHFNFDKNQIIDMSIIDMTGKTVLSDQLLNKQNTIQLNGISEGVYFLRLQRGSESSIQKFIIK